MLRLMKAYQISYCRSSNKRKTLCIRSSHSTNWGRSYMATC